MTTPTPAQADEKALESWIADQAPAILAMYRFDSEDDLRRAREAFDILKARVPKFAALRPEVETVAVKQWQWKDSGHSIWTDGEPPLAHSHEVEVRVLFASPAPAQAALGDAGSKEERG